MDAEAPLKEEEEHYCSSTGVSEVVLDSTGDPSPRGSSWPCLYNSACEKTWISGEEVQEIPEGGPAVQHVEVREATSHTGLSSIFSQLVGFPHPILSILNAVCPSSFCTK